jgi:urease accessory protein
MEIGDLALLRLLHLADSALPVGAAAHSFGLESLIEDGCVTVDGLEEFLRGYLEESGALDAGYCRAAHELSRVRGDEFEARWEELNRRLSARRIARESREASLTMGRRFLALAATLLAPADLPAEAHHVAAFGLAAGFAGVDERSTVLGWLHQSVAALVSAAQRLAPLGQTRASGILWSLKPLMAEIAEGGADCFMPLPEVAAMRHSKLPTRLFIS